jgi:hypothetical protein
MISTANRYIQELGRLLRGDVATRREILREVRSHLEDLVSELQNRGLSPEAAWREAERLFGSPRDVASGLYAAHNRAALHAACLAALPHVLFALLFATHLWQYLGVLGIFLIFASVTSVLAWRKGAPAWIYPWLGYCLVAPAALWLFSFSYIGGATLHFLVRGTVGMPVLLYLLGAVYVFVALRIAWNLVVHTVRRDWLFTTLMIFPFPILTSWIAFMDRNGGVFSYDRPAVISVDDAMALVFLGLALTTAVVYRVGERSRKIAILCVTLPLIAALAGIAHLGTLWSLGVFLLLLSSIGIMIIPAVLESRLVHADGTAA